MTAGVAELVEHRTCYLEVAGLVPTDGRCVLSSSLVSFHMYHHTYNTTEKNYK